MSNAGRLLVVMILVQAMIVSTASAAETVTAEPRIESRLCADLTGDGIPDILVLEAKGHSPRSQFSPRRVLTLTDGANAHTSVLDLGEAGAGYLARLWAADITGNGTPEILVTVQSGGSAVMVTPFVISAVGGSLHHALDGNAMLSEPAVNWSTQDHYQVRFYHQFGSGVVGLVDSNVYSGYFSADGKLENPLEIELDPVGAVETQTSANGKAEIVTYRKVWAVFHANTIAMVRTVWRWDGSTTRPEEIAVTPLFTAVDYRTMLKGLNCPGRRVDELVATAVEEYMARFKLAPQPLREEGFNAFRKFHMALGEKVTGAVNYELARAGFARVYAGEGMWNVVPDTEFYRKTFGRLLGPEYKQFIELDGRELMQPYARDAALAISLGETGARVAAWEHFIASYPGSQLLSEATRRYTWLLSALLAGTDNTPHVDYATGKVKVSALEALRTHARLYPGTASAQAALKALDIYSQHKTVTNAVRTRIMKLVDEAVTASPSSPR